METKQLLGGCGEASLLQVMGSDLSIINAARVSFASASAEFGEREAKLLRFLAENRHTSPFEHCTLQFYCRVPLFVARQHMRHRTWSYNEISRRYTSARLDVYRPNMLMQQDAIRRQCSAGQIEEPELPFELLDRAISTSLDVYQRLIDSGVSREQARMVLPCSTFTEYVATVNLHNLGHFLRLRLKSDAQFEIRVLAEAMREMAQVHFPETFKAWDELGILNG